MLGTRDALDRPTGRISVGAVAADRDVAAPVSLRRVLGAAAVPTAPAPQLRPRSWRNWIDDLDTRTFTTAQRPTELAEVVAAVQLALDAGLRVRAVGAGHSSSRAAQPDARGIALDTTGLAGATHARWLRPEVDGRRLVTVGAGTRVKVLNRQLLLPMGLALPNMGSFDWQTVAGALTTGTHGSGIHTGPMADIVRSVDLVVVSDGGDGPEVRAHRLEPTAGITDPAAFAAAGPEHGLRLLQDDDLFHAAVVAFGSTGVITAMTLELTDQSWLRETVAATPWSQLRQQLADTVHHDGHEVPRVLTTTRHWEFLVNAAQVQRRPVQDPICQVRARVHDPDPPQRPPDWTRPWPPRRAPASDLQELAELLRTGHVLTGRGPTRRFVANRIRDSLAAAAGRASFVGDHRSSRSDIVLRRERDPSAATAEPEPPPGAISNELAVPIEQTIAAVDRVLHTMEHSDHFHAVPFGVRFTAASPHVMAPQHGRPTTLIEVPLRVFGRRDPPPLPGGPSNARLLAAAKDALAALEVAFRDDPALDVRPHWGQYHRLDRAALEAAYPAASIAALEAARARFDAAGTFSNAHTRQLGLST